MNSTDTKSFYIALVAAMVAMALLYSHSQNQKKEYYKKFGAEKRVVVAAKEIRSLETIDETHLMVINKPAEFAEEGAISEIDQLVGKVSAVPFLKGETILSNKLLDPGPDTGISMQVAPNSRAISIPVDQVRGVSKLIKPGDRIDIITSVVVGSGQNQYLLTKTLLQDVPVLATGKRVINNIPRLLELDESTNSKYWVNLTGDIDFSTITIEANPKQAQDLIYHLVEDPTKIYLSLRNPTDRFVAQVPPTTKDTIAGRDAMPTPAAPAARPNLQLNRGTPSRVGN